jgi:hypothetical protein
MNSMEHGQGTSERLGSEQSCRRRVLHHRDMKHSFFKIKGKSAEESPQYQEPSRVVEPWKFENRARSLTTQRRLGLPRPANKTDLQQPWSEIAQASGASGPEQMTLADLDRSH